VGLGVSPSPNRSGQGSCEITDMNELFIKLKQWHDRTFALVSHGQSAFLLFVRLYWGWQLWQSGWGKLHSLDKVTEFFASLNMLAPAQMAVFIACVEFFGGILFALGAFSRITSLVLTVNLTMAYILADRIAFFSIFSDPDKFTAAAPFNLLVASLIVLIFGPGKICVDEAIGYAVQIHRARQPRRSKSLPDMQSKKA
jgi:putative oxidoreductase